MSRPKPRGAAIADRLSEVLQDDLADIASTMDWIDAAPVAAPVVTPAGKVAPLAEPVDPLADQSLDLMLDDFALAVDAMFSSRDRILATDGISPDGEPAEDGWGANDSNDPQTTTGRAQG